MKTGILWIIDQNKPCFQSGCGRTGNRNESALKKAFDPDAFLHGYFDGRLVHLPFSAWLKQIESRPAPSKSGEAYEMKIMSVDITDNIAQVKVFDLYMGKYFTDYLSMIKVEDNWVIINKMFHHQ